MSFSMRARALRALLLATLTGLTLSTAAAATEVDFLEPAQAFRGEARLLDARLIEVRLNVAPGYHLYRERMSVELDGAGAQLGTVELPVGKVAFDETFQKNVEVLQGSVLIRVPVQSAAADFRVRVNYQGCADKGLCYSPQTSLVTAGVSVATVIALGLAPVLLLVGGSVQRRRAPTLIQVVTVTTALVGLCLVSIAGGSGDSAPHAALGILAAFGSGTAYALSTHVGAPLSREHDALAVTTATMSVAAAVLIPGGLVVAYLRDEPMTTTDGESWLLLVYLGVVTMAFAYVLLYAGLRSTTSGSAVVATLLEPVTAVLIAVLLLGERPTAAVVVGTLLILAAIATLGREVEQEPQPQ